MSTDVPWAAWFDGRMAVRSLPRQCIKDCSAPGDRDEAVDHWLKKLQLEAPPWLLRRYLRSLGAWSGQELCDHQQNLRRLLWTWACDCRESNSNDPIYLGF